MLDNDNLTYSAPKRLLGKQADRALLTVDRSQKLDLLVHLLTNLEQPLVVCGPKGIGKTTLLNVLQSNFNDTWPICLLQGSSGMSFENIVTQLSRFLNISNASIGFDMSTLKAFCQNQKIVLAIDNAGELLPGLIGELIDFADSLAGLRLVLALNDEEFRGQSSAERTLDNAHFIELPPLNLRQCLEYLRNLSGQSGSRFAQADISDEWVEEVYMATHGVPGSIVSYLAKQDNSPGRQSRKTALWLSIAVVLAAAGYGVSQLLPDSAQEPATGEEQEQVVAETLAEPAEPAAPEEEAPAPEPVAESALPETTIPAQETPAEPDEPLAAQAEPSPAIETPIAPAPANQPLAANASKETAPPQPAKPAAQPETPTAAAAQTDTPAEAQSAAGPQAVTPPPAAEKEVPKAEPAPTPPPAEKTAEPPKTQSDADNGDLEWIKAQPGGNYTLQLMVISNKTSALRLKKKYPQYVDSLKYFAIGKDSQEKYVIIFGSFATGAEALNMKNELPKELSQGMVKRFSAVLKLSRQK